MQDFMKVYFAIVYDVDDGAVVEVGSFVVVVLVVGEVVDYLVTKLRHFICKSEQL